MVILNLYNSQSFLTANVLMMPSQVINIIYRNTTRQQSFPPDLSLSICCQTILKLERRDAHMHRAPRVTQCVPSAIVKPNPNFLTRNEMLEFTWNNLFIKSYYTDPDHNHNPENLLFVY